MTELENEYGYRTAPVRHPGGAAFIVSVLLGEELVEIRNKNEFF